MALLGGQVPDCGLSSFKGLGFSLLVQGHVSVPRGPSKFAGLLDLVIGGCPHAWPSLLVNFQQEYAVILSVCQDGGEILSKMLHFVLIAGKGAVYTSQFSPSTSSST